MGQSRTLWWVVTVCMVCFVSTVRGGEPREVTTEVRQVALFKNGLGYFLREGKLPDEAGPFVIRALPASSHGTFWISCDRSVRLPSLVAREARRTETVEVTGLTDLVRANLGKKARLFGVGEEPVVGRLLDLVAAEPEQAADPYASGPASFRSGRYPDSGYDREIVFLETEEGMVAVSPRRLQRVDILQQDVNRSLETEVGTVELAGVLAEARGKRDFTVSYLAKGITWAPSYRIDIADGDLAAISAKAVVINEVEDLEDVTLQLITGVPHVQFADVPSPLSLKLDLAQFFRSLSRPPEETANIMSNRAVVLQQRAMYPRDSRRGVLPAYAAGSAGETAEDLFLYPLKHVTQAKGEVGYHPLFSALVPCEHVYRWDMPDYLDEASRRSRPYDRDAEAAQVVWHSIRLQNTSPYPWTTAPAMTAAEGQILGQDTLTYTPVAASVTLKLTQAVGVAADEQEREVDRDREGVTLQGRRYEKVTIEGELRVRNSKPEPITIEITKTFAGDLVSSVPEAKVEQLASGLKAVNATNLLTWVLEVKPEEERELNYTYTVLVRR